jgi:hypothetical protein
MNVVTPSQKILLYAWLGFWRDKMPSEAVTQIQDILGTEHGPKNAMKDPIAEMCDIGHRYYTEEGSNTRCPECLATGLSKAREEVRRLRVRFNFVDPF